MRQPSPAIATNRSNADVNSLIVIAAAAARSPGSPVMSEGSLIENVGVVCEDAPPGMQQEASARPGMEEPSARASKNQKHKGRRQMDDE